MEAIKLSLKILKSVMEEKINASNVQVATVTAGEGFKMEAESSLETVIASLA